MYSFNMKINYPKGLKKSLPKLVILFRVISKHRKTSESPTLDLSSQRT